MTEESLNESQMVQFMQFKMQEEGVLSKIKLQVRKELIDKLVGEQQVKKPFKNFEIKLLDCYMQNFLKTNNYNCSHDIFTQESFLQEKDYLTTQELLQVIGLTLRDYEDFAFRLSENNISAFEILIRLIKKRYYIEKQDHSCQTESGEESYEQKMRKMENQYLKKIDYSRLNDMKTIEERMNALKFDIERKCKAQYEADLARIRDWEIENMRQQERNHYNDLLRQKQGDGDKEYYDKLKELKKKEQEALDKLDRRKKELERNLFDKQQQLQKQIEEIQQEKIKMHRHKCLESDDVKKALEEVEGIKQDLQKAISEYKIAKDNLEKQIQKQQQEVQQYWKDKTKENCKKDYAIEQDQEFIKFQKDSCYRLEQQRQYLQKENDVLKNENIDLKYKVNEYEKDLEKDKRQLELLKDEQDIKNHYIRRLEGQVKIYKEFQEQDLIRQSQP